MHVANTNSVVLPVAVLLWRDDAYAGLGEPTTAEDVVNPSTSTQRQRLKANTAMYRKFYLTGQSDKKILSLKVPFRLRMLKDGEMLKLTVSNLEPATNPIEYFVQGQIISRHP